MPSAAPKLSNLQQELLRIYSFNISETDLKALRRFLVKHFSKKAVQSAGEAWKGKKLSNEVMDKWLHENS